MVDDMIALKEPAEKSPLIAHDQTLDDARRQPSQFDATFLSSLLAVRPTHREVYLLPAAALATDPSPIDPCAP